MGVGVDGDLRQVRHAEHLVLAGQAPEAPPHALRRAGADPRVDLVEDERGRGVGGGEDLFHRERDPRELATGGDARERHGRLPRVRGDQELHRLGTGHTELARDQLHVEPGLPEPERLERARHRRGKPVPGHPAGVRQGRRRLAGRGLQPQVVGQAGRSLRLQPLQPLGRGSCPGAVHQHGFLVGAVLAFECVDQPESLLEVRDGGGIVVEGTRRPSQLRHHVIRLGEQRVDPLRQPRESPVQAGQVAAVPGDACQHVAGSRPLPRQPIAHQGHQALDLCGTGRGCQALADLVCLTGTEAGRLDLGRLVPVQLELSGHRPRIPLQRVQGRPVGPPCLHGRGHGRPQGRMPAVRVEQVPLVRGIEQPLLVVLAVDLHERPGHVGQPRGGDGGVVHPRGAAARRRHLAHADQRFGVAIEQRLHPRERRAGPDQARVGTGTQHEHQRVDQQRLAGPRLPGDHGEARVGLQPDPLDQREVADVQLEQRHEGSSCAFSRRRSQNAGAPRGSTKRTGRWRARTSTTSPTFSITSSCPSMLTRMSNAARTCTRTV